MTRKRTKKAAGEGDGGGRPPEPEPAATVSEDPVPGWWPAFLMDFVMTNNVVLSARECGVTRQAVYDLCERRPELKEQFDAATGLRAGMLRKVAFKIGTQGIELPVYSMREVERDGQKVMEKVLTGYDTKWDARVLLACLAAELPEFRGRADGGTTVINNQVSVGSPGVPEGIAAFVDAVRQLAAGQAAGGPAPDGGRGQPPALVDRKKLPHPGGGR